MAVKDDKVRKIVTVDNEAWAALEDIRYSGRFATEAHLLRYLIRLGVEKHCEMTGHKMPKVFLTAERKGKKR